MDTIEQKQLRALFPVPEWWLDHPIDPEEVEVRGAAREKALDRLVAIGLERVMLARRSVVEPHHRREIEPLLSLFDLLASERSSDAAELACWLHAPLDALDRLDEILPLLERAAKLPELPVRVRAAVLSNLASSLRSKGRPEASLEPMRRAMTLLTDHYEPDDPILAACYVNLAMIRQDLGQLDEARDWLERAIAVERANLAPDDPDLAVSYSNLALVLQQLGQLVEARAWLEEALHIQERCGSPMDFAKACNNLAGVVFAQGETEGARHLLQQAFLVLERHLGPDHPEVQNVLQGLTVVSQPG